jgi:hypothetical protein
MVMPNTAYVAISHQNEAYTMPDKPEPPNYVGATQVVIAELNSRYNRAMDTYKETKELYNHLKALLIQAVPEIYISILSDHVLGYANVSPQQLLAHLVDTYGKLTAKELQANLQRLQAPWDPDTPIELVFTNGAKCRQLAADGNDPITDAAYIRVLIQIFHTSGVLDKAVDDWEDKPEVEHTVATAMTHFTRADDNRRARQQGMKGTLTANTAVQNTSANKGPTEPIRYCWSHGICDHTSAKCNQPAEGHVKTATFANLKTHGGCTFLQRPQGFKAVFKPKVNTNRRNRNPNRENQTPSQVAQVTAPSASA